MNKFSQTKNIFKAILIIDIIAFVLYGALFFLIKNKNQDTSTLLNNAERDLKKDEFLRVAKFSLDQNRAEVEKLDTFFVAKDGVPNFIEYIEGLGKESGVALSIGNVSVEPDTKNKDDFKEILRLKVEMLGSWQELFTFLSIIENLPYRVQIDNVSFAVDASEEALFFGGEASTTNSSLSGGNQWKGFIEFTLLKLR